MKPLEPIPLDLSQPYGFQSRAHFDRQYQRTGARQLLEALRAATDDQGVLAWLGRVARDTGLEGPVEQALSDPE